MQSWILTSNLWFLNTHDTYRANSHAHRWTMLMKANLVWKNNNLFYSEFTLSAIDHLANRQDKMFTFTSHFYLSVFLFGQSCLTCIDTSCVVVPLLSYYLVGVTFTCIILFLIIIIQVSDILPVISHQWYSRLWQLITIFI